MGWRVWGTDFESGELASTAKFQTFRPNADILLRYVRTWFIFINDPIFTDLSVKLYSNEVRSGDNTPVELLASTDARTKSELITLENGVKETGFEFSSVIPLQANTYYNIVINGTGYIPTASSYIAWMKAFPDPVYSTDYTPAIETINYAPYQVYFISGVY